MTINYSHQRLEEILGGELEPLPEEDLIQRLCARAITDSVGSSHSAEVKFNNAMHWMLYLQSVSYNRGKQAEHHRRDQELRELLGMKGIEG